MKILLFNEEAIKRALLASVECDKQTASVRLGVADANSAYGQENGRIFAEIKSEDDD